MIIKCCGLNPSRDVQLCLDLKVNFLGFIFYEKSPRNIKISDLDILKNYNRKNSLFTAVTVNASNDLIDQIQSENSKMPKAPYGRKAEWWQTTK